MDEDLKGIEAYLHTHIPLSRQMGVTVVEAGGGGVRLHAPLGPNINHRGTVFGGSASALAILAGWTLLYARLRALPFAVRIVIRRNTVAYVRPMPGDVEAVCPSPPEPVWHAFEAMLAQRGKGRIALEADVWSTGERAATFTGEYVVLRLEDRG
jgi:thioesterase domain-containing protein